MKLVLVTGGFDPLHSGHIAYFKSAKEFGDLLCVGLNSDEWLTRKKGQPFMTLSERMTIIENLSCVDLTISFDDSDNSAINAIEKIKALYPEYEIIFANGGDRNETNIPEMIFDDVEFKFGVGGNDKKNSSSWILNNWTKPTIQRKWGSYKVLDKNGKWQVKELSFDIGKALSDQKHMNRSEHWHLVQGSIRMDLEFNNGDKESKTYHSGDSIDIPINTWHKAINIGTVPAKVIEVWVGSILSEDDIERRD